jgi:iron complex transport system substrate-binding protein
MTRVVHAAFPAIPKPLQAPSARRDLLAAITLMILALAGGCGERGDREDGRLERGGAAATESAAAAPPFTGRTGPVRAIADLRIVSLSPAMSQVLVDLGLGERIVGRTPFCDALPREIPVVGSLLDVDYERLLLLAPTHLVVQPAASGTDPELERLALAHDWVLIEQGLDRLEDVATFVEGLPDGLRIEAEEGSEAAGEVRALHERARAATAQVRALVRAPSPMTHAAPVRTLLLVGTDPPTAAGRATFVDEMLIAAGGINAVEVEGYPELTLEAIVGLDPERILVLREVAMGANDVNLLLAPLRSTATRAARDKAVGLFIDPSVMLPSTQAPAVVERLRRVLAPTSVTDEAAGDR